MRRARFTVVEPALFERNVFEMAALIQSPTKCAIQFLNAKVNVQQKFTKQIVAVYGNVMNWQK